MCNCDLLAGFICSAHLNEANRQRRTEDEAIAFLRAKLMTYPEGVGKATFTRTDGQTVVVDNVLFDTISAVATNAGVVSMDVHESEHIVHVPFVASWVIDY